MLEGRDVLILVDDKEAVLLTHLLRDARLYLDHACRGEQHVFKVELPTIVFEVLVGLLKIRDLLDRERRRQRTAARGILLDAQPRDLAPFDFGRRVAQRRRIEFEPDCVCGVREQPPLALEQLWHRAADHLRPKKVQLREGGCVKSTRGDSARPEGPQSRP